MKPLPLDQLLERSASIVRGTYTPAYIQLVQIVRQWVAAGWLRPGDQLPSEAQLCRRFGLSPMTVRRAIGLLVDQGVVSTRQGAGTYVRALGLGAAQFALASAQGLFGDPEHTTVRLLEARVVRADARTARKLRLAPGQRVIFIRRLLESGGQPVCIHREYLIYDATRPIVEAEMEATALHSLLYGHGETLFKYGELTMEAALLSDEEARWLAAPQPMAAICLEHVFFDYEDQPLSWGWFIGRADRVRLATQVGLPPAARQP